MFQPLHSSRGMTANQIHQSCESHKCWFRWHPQFLPCIPQGWSPRAWRTAPLEYHLPAACCLPWSPHGWSLACNPVPNYSRHSQVKSRGCRAAFWRSWRVSQREVPCECWPPCATGCWCYVSQWWAPSRICGCHTGPSFSSQWTDSTYSTSSSPRPEPKPPETRYVSEIREILQTLLQWCLN